MSVILFNADVRAALAVTAIFSSLILFPAVTSAAPPESKHMSTLGEASSRNISNLLQDQIEQSLESRGGKVQHLISVRLVVDRSIVIIDLSKDYLPGSVNYIGSELEDKLSLLRNIVVGIVENELGYQISEVEFLFDGRPLAFYYPYDFSRRPNKISTVDNSISGALVVSAGHGVYLHHETTPDWRFQRDQYHGVQEDLVTQPLASDLSDLLIARSGTVTDFVRSFGNSIHAPSGNAWNDLSARYYLAEILPLRTDIWNTLPNSTAALRERDEDIRSRPFYANDINAEAIISIHTNGDETGTARGVRVYHYPGRAGDAAIATSMLCYMREIIQAQPGYEGFPVATAPHASTTHGENRLSDVPAVIVETAFHSNAADAAALLDPVFRMAAMKGVENLGFPTFSRA